MLLFYQVIKIGKVKDKKIHISVFPPLSSLHRCTYLFARLNSLPSFIISMSISHQMSSLLLQLTPYDCIVSVGRSTNILEQRTTDSEGFCGLLWNLQASRAADFKDCRALRAAGLVGCGACCLWALRAAGLAGCGPCGLWTNWTMQLIFLPHWIQ